MPCRVIFGSDLTPLASLTFQKSGFGFLIALQVIERGVRVSFLDLKLATADLAQVRVGKLVPTVYRLVSTIVRWSSQLLIISLHNTGTIDLTELLLLLLYGMLNIVHITTSIGHNSLLPWQLIWLEHPTVYFVDELRTMSLRRLRKPRGGIDVGGLAALSRSVCFGVRLPGDWVELLDIHDLGLTIYGFILVLVIICYVNPLSVALDRFTSGLTMIQELIYLL